MTPNRPEDRSVIFGVLGLPHDMARDDFSSDETLQTALTSRRSQVTSTVRLHDPTSYFQPRLVYEVPHSVALDLTKTIQLFFSNFESLHAHTINAEREHILSQEATATRQFYHQSTAELPGVSFHSQRTTRYHQPASLVSIHPFQCLIGARTGNHSNVGIKYKALDVQETSARRHALISSGFTGGLG